MKKFLCFALVLCLALAPVGVFADEYDNGENGEYYAVEGYENGDEPTEYYNGDEPTGYENGDEQEAEVKPVDVEGVEEGIMAISADLGQRWTFGMGDVAEGFSFAYYVDGSRYLATYADGLWVAAAEDADDWAIDAESGDVTPVEGFDAVVVWYAKADGLFYVTGSFIGNGSAGSVLLNGEVEENFEYTVDIHLELELVEGDELTFVTSGTETANWNIVIREVVVLEEVEDDVVDEPANEEVDIVPVDEPVVDPLADVPVRYVDGVEFVAFRLFANAFGYYSLAWDGATSTVTVVDVVSFTLVEAGGFNDNGVVYVPMAFALSLF